jgi:CMP-N-acetylneuraminic acid synthetase
VKIQKLNSKILAIIPARAGSKGIKDKNIRKIREKPLIAYTIEVARESNIFDKIIVSTDSEIIAEIAKQYGAEIPFLRPQEIATDEAKSIDVLIHAMTYFKENDENFDYIMMLQPTSPLRSVKDIINAVNLINEKDANAVVSVCETDHPPLWSNTLPESLLMDQFLLKEVREKRRQDIPKYYRLNGAIYLAKADYLMKTKDWYEKNSYAYIMEKENSLDIDTELDLQILDYLMSKKYKL